MGSAAASPSPARNSAAALNLTSTPGDRRDAEGEPALSFLRSVERLHDKRTLPASIVSAT